MHSVGWRLRTPPGSGAKVQVLRPASAQLTVRKATTLLLRPKQEQRYRQQRQFVRQAVDGRLPQHLLNSYHNHLLSTQRRLWHAVRWENQQKEVWWRLVVQGVPAAGGHGICLRGACACGYAVPAEHHNKESGADLQRRHVFWGCPVARAVVRELQRGLGGAERLQRFEVWLVHPPPYVHNLVWGAVCLAAVSAMEHGRKVLYAMRMADQEAAAATRAAGGRQATLLELWGMQRREVPLSAVERAAARAAADFWCRVYDFVHASSADTALLAAVTSQSVLIGKDDQGRLCVNVPGMPAR